MWDFSLGLIGTKPRSEPRPGAIRARSKHIVQVTHLGVRVLAFRILRVDLSTAQSPASVSQKVHRQHGYLSRGSRLNGKLVRSE